MPPASCDKKEHFSYFLRPFFIVDMIQNCKQYIYKTFWQQRRIKCYFQLNFYVSVLLLFFILKIVNFIFPVLYDIHSLFYDTGVQPSGYPCEPNSAWGTNTHKIPQKYMKSRSIRSLQAKMKNQIILKAKESPYYDSFNSLNLLKAVSLTHTIFGLLLSPGCSSRRAGSSSSSINWLWFSVLRLWANVWV